MRVNKQLLESIMKLNLGEWQTIKSVVDYYFDKVERREKKNLRLDVTDVFEQIDRGWNIPFSIQLENEEK